jgi:hypothetical protein
VVTLYCSGESVLGSLYSETPIEEFVGKFSFLLKNEILFIGWVAHSPVTVMTILTHLLDLNNTVLQKIKWKEA